MHNLDTDTLPHRLRVSEEVQLKPWFSKKLLEGGLDVLRKNRLTAFYSLRGATGAIIDDDALLTVQFDRSTRLLQGFVIRNGYCGMCHKRAGRDACEHLAALALLSLAAPEKEKKIPLPLAFAGGDWEKIGVFLHEWLGVKGFTVTGCETNETNCWEAVAKDGGSFRILLPEAWRLQAEMLLPGMEANSERKKRKLFDLLRHQLEKLTMTQKERDLETAGVSGIGWKRDTSFWVWLAKMLYCLQGGHLPRFQHIPGEFRFLLSLENQEGSDGLQLILPGAKAWHLLRQLPFDDADAAILPAARKCFRVGFNSETELEVVPCLRLEDGRVLERESLGKNRFPGGYYLAGEGFLPVQSRAEEGNLTREPLQKGLPLLGFLHEEVRGETSYTIAFKDIPAFIEANHKALHHPDNIVAAEVLNTEVHILPERLIIEDFEEHRDWCYLSCHYGIGNTRISLTDIFAAREKGLPCLPGERWLQIENTPLSWLYELGEDRLVGDGSGRIRMRLQEILALSGTVGTFDIQTKKPQLQQQLADLLDDSRWGETTFLPGSPEHLRDYQRNGLAWLMRLYAMGIGGLLADDMGLGKTHQALALLQAVPGNDREKAHLVVCPASVVLSWADKIDTFYPELKYAVYYGAQRDLTKAGKSGLILTTYGVVRQDLELLRHYSFDVVILDEIQYLKNRSTVSHRAIAALNFRIAIGLTGTPVENSLHDLYSLFDLCLPGLLGSERQFDDIYVRPITEAGSRQAREVLSRLVRPFVLRRNRRQVLAELPEIIEDNRICELSDDQVGLYRRLIDERRTMVSSLEDEGTPIPYMNILATITRLKQICNHPSLVHGSRDPEKYASGKWDLFVELSRELLDAGMKFVVFSQYTGMLALMESYFNRMGIGFCSLQGSMPVRERRKMIDLFNENPQYRVFCASLLAGGVGIDLTSAQAVIHYDRWWNPAKEEQATARVHRMGQKNVVQVFRLITRGTLEEKIHRLIGRKQELAEMIIQEDEANIIKQLDRRELMELFRPAQPLSSS